jgi:hypothetical protein
MGGNATKVAKAAIERGEGILRLAPAWVPRAFLTPGRRLKLAPQDYYALGTHRGGIDERWFASTTPAANPGAPPDEGLSYIVTNGDRALLKEAVAADGPTMIGQKMWEAYKRWPVYSKFFDNMGPIPHHLHQNAEQAARIGMEGKPEAYYFPTQLNYIGNNFPYTFYGLEPGTTKADIRRCLERWNEGDNGILDFSKAYRLTPGTGWVVPPCTLHAPGSLVTYEPQWGSDVFAMYQSLVEDRPVSWDLLTVNVPKDKHQDLDYLVDQIDWEENTDPNFKLNHYIEPIVDESQSGEGYTDKWITYGRFKGKQLFSAKQLTVMPGAKAAIKDNGASGVIVVQGRGRIGGLPAESPTMIRFGEMTEDEFFITDKRAKEGYTVENLAKECPLVLLRYFGPAVNPQAPEIGDHRKK